jgi:glycine/D-amino acid oxidase-like deaminating enzyme
MPDFVSLWAETAAPSPDWPRLAEHVEADVAIIGAGYTGLSAALHLAEAGSRVVVVDAETPGWGASGRNGGQVIPGLKYDPGTLRALFGQAQGGRLVAAVGAAPELVFSLIERLSIACEPVRAGWLQPAVSSATLATVEERARQWQAEGVATRVLDRAETTRLTGSGIYAGALLDPRGGTVQPLAYAQGLAQAAQRAGARIFGESRATGLAQEAGAWRVPTAAGSVRAQKIVFAVNAYADGLHPSLRRSVVAVPSFQVATETLPQNLLETILPEGHAASDMRLLLRYFRVFRGRLVMGARGSFAASPPPRLLARMRRAIANIFPQAAGLRIEYAWGGMVAVTADHLPHLHEPAPGLLAGLGYNGRGVAMATLMGKVLAERALGTPAASLKFPVSPLREIKLHEASRVGAQIAIEILRLRDRLSG